MPTIFYPSDCIDCPPLPAPSTTTEYVYVTIPTIAGALSTTLPDATTLSTTTPALSPETSLPAQSAPNPPASMQPVATAAIAFAAALIGSLLVLAGAILLWRRRRWARNWSRDTFDPEAFVVSSRAGSQDSGCDWEAPKYPSGALLPANGGEARPRPLVRSPTGSAAFELVSPGWKAPRAGAMGTLMPPPPRYSTFDAPA